MKYDDLSAKLGRIHQDNERSGTETDPPTTHRRRQAWMAVTVLFAFVVAGLFFWTSSGRLGVAGNDSTTNLTKPRAGDAERGVSKSRPAGTRFFFTIIDQAGRPVVGANVAITHAFGRGPGSPQFGVSAKHFPPDATLFPSAITDADGIVRLQVPDDDALANAGYPVDRMIRIRETLRQPDISFQLQIDHPAHPQWQGHAGGRGTVPIALPEGTDIAVTAHLGNDPAPADRLYPILGHWKPLKFDDENGVLMIRNVDLSGQNQSLRVVRVLESGPAWFSKLLDLSARGHTPQLAVDVELKLGVRLEGQLAESVPRPIKNGRVVASFVGPGSFSVANWVAATPIASDGTFAFESLPPNENAQLVAVCDGWVSQSPSVKDVKAFSNQHRFSAGDYESLFRASVYKVFPQLVHLEGPVTQSVLPMVRTSIAEVRVLDERGQPIENVYVGFSPNEVRFNSGASLVGWGFDHLTWIREQLNSGQPSIDDEPWSTWTRNRYSAQTDKRGIATVAGLPAGTGSQAGEWIEQQLVVTHDDYVLMAPKLMRGGQHDTTTIQLAEGQKSTVNVQMKRR